MKKYHVLIYLVITFFWVLNFANLKKLHLIDWDEGVFALQAKWLATMGANGKPFNFQTPPLFQGLIALSFLLGGSKPWILPMLSVIFSGLSIYVLFHLARNLYNEKVGFIAVLLFATSEFFLFFSKSGLSDATFVFFFLSAIYFFHQSLTHESSINYLGCSFFTFLACYTKYTGPILFLIYLLVSLWYRRKKKFNFYFLIIVLPLLLLIPYYFIFLKFISMQNIFQRHGHLLGINHLKFLYYLFRFAPTIFLTSLFYPLKEKHDYFILIILTTFFVPLGFYYPYFRLAYPLIPILTIISSRFIYQFKKSQFLLTAMVVIFNLFLGWNTILFHSDFPVFLTHRIDKICESYGVNYVIAAAPPNILFYIPGNIILIEENLPKIAQNSQKFGLSKRRIIKREENFLQNEESVLFLHSSIFDEIEEELKSLKNPPKLEEAYEFIDAPVYYKDIFNKLKEVKQIYKISLFTLSTLPQAERKILEKIAFKSGVTVIQR